MISALPAGLFESSASGQHRQNLTMSPSSTHPVIPVFCSNTAPTHWLYLKSERFIHLGRRPELHTVENWWGRQSWAKTTVWCSQFHQEEGAAVYLSAAQQQACLNQTNSDRNLKELVWLKPSCWSSEQFAVSWAYSSPPLLWRAEPSENKSCHLASSSTWANDC